MGPTDSLLLLVSFIVVPLASLLKTISSQSHNSDLYVSIKIRRRKIGTPRSGPRYGCPETPTLVNCPDKDEHFLDTKVLSRTFGFFIKGRRSSRVSSEF